MSDQKDDEQQPDGANATIVSVREQGQGPASSTGSHASLFMIHEAEVEEHTLQRDACIAAIGTDANEVDIVIEEPDCAKKQLVVMNIGNHWMFLDCGPQDVVWMDGMKRRQLYAPIDFRGVIRVGQQYMVFAGGGAPTDSLETSAKGDIVKTEDPGESATVRVRGFGSEKLSRQWPVLIGSHSACDLVEETLDPFHAFVYWSEEGAMLESIGHSVVEVKNVALTGPVLVEETLAATLGGTAITVSIEGDAKAQGTALFKDGIDYESFALTALNDSVDDSFYLPGFGRPVSIGRAESCDIVLNDMAVSREHAQLVPAGKTLNLIDNFSANGTFVNGIKVPKARVRAGDIIEIGDNFFLVHYT